MEATLSCVAGWTPSNFVVLLQLQPSCEGFILPPIWIISKHTRQHFHSVPVGSKAPAFPALPFTRPSTRHWLQRCMTICYAFSPMSKPVIYPSFLSPSPTYAPSLARVLRSSSMARNYRRPMLILWLERCFLKA